jgi:hypothetical protein
MSVQLTPNTVVMQLAELARDLDATVRSLRDADLEAVRARHQADLAESRAFVSAEGSMDLRKHLARLACAKEEEDALVKEAVVRYLRNRINAISTRIDVGRSAGAALRAELAAMPYDQTT